MIYRSLKLRFLRRFDLRRDQSDHEEIDRSFRDGVEFRGTNLWVLIFAIFIASVGLNVNSTAVVIGAMLISPLMGPIMGLGYGAAVNDSPLMRSSLFNLFLAALISLITSTLYFWLTPLTHAASELLARTTPSLWDVLIALFGGLAGAIGVTRKVKSNLVPGVAIATALMPPLCTAGYGLATWNLAYFFGAFYLFSINCVFIAYATILMVKVMRLPRVKPLHEESVNKHRVVLTLVILVTVVPSIYLAAKLVQKEWFLSNTVSFVSATLKSNTQVLVVGQDADFDAQTLRVNLVGKRLTPEEEQAIDKRLPEFGLQGVKLSLAQSSQDMPDINVVKKDILNDFVASNRNDLAQKEAEITLLKQQLQALQNQQNAQLPLQSIFNEISGQFPNALSVSVTSGLHSVPPSKALKSAGMALSSEALARGRDALVVQLELPAAISQDEQLRLRQGWRVRANFQDVDDVQLIVKVTAPPKAQKPKKPQRRPKKP